MWFKVMRPLEDAGKKKSRMADFNVMMVVVDLGPQQIERTYCLSDQLSQCLIHPYQPSDVRNPLVVIIGTLTAQRYVDDILRTVLLPFLLQYLGLIFHQNNARPLTACVAMNCLTAFQTLPWLNRSLDLSPVEHVWDMMGRRLHLHGNADDLTPQLEHI
ncbi:transposable element Tcb1 transposase [Trichonephila clavipes]|nr:transposable element Tcb1 transposase [Trichonephila clavipes]